MTPHELAQARYWSILAMLAGMLLGLGVGIMGTVLFLSGQHQLCETTCVELGALQSTDVGRYE